MWPEITAPYGLPRLAGFESPTIARESRDPDGDPPAFRTDRAAAAPADRT
jgi:hypothetical protein